LNSDGTYASTALLANNQTFVSTLSNIESQVDAQVAGITSGNPSSLSDIGITLTNQPATSTAPEVDNILNVNDSTLSSALTSNFQGVSNLFGFNLTSNNPNLTIFSHTNALSVTNFTLNIDPGMGTFTATYDEGSGPVTVNLTAQALGSGVTGYTLTGPDGSALEGLQLIYGSSATSTINVTATQGIADTVYNSSNAATTANTGTLAIAMQSLQDSDTRLNQDITNVNAQVAVYQQQLVNEFSALEQAISQTNTLLQSLNANSNAALVAAGQ